MAPSTNGLKSSIWASSGQRSQSLPPHKQPHVASTASANPTTQSTSTSITRLRTAPTEPLDPVLALHRFEKTCHRLRWKKYDLLHSLERAKDPEQWGFSAEEAQMNFKVDFHETYIWIEQALVFLQLVFGVVIPRGGGPDPSLRGAHAFHHNVLQSLSDASGPLYEVLGKGTAKEALWKAKELRNKWKDVGMQGADSPSVWLYSIPWILDMITEGLDKAYVLAQIKADEARGQGADALADEGWDWMMGDEDVEMMDMDT